MAWQRVRKRPAEADQPDRAAVRSFWSGTISFGLVSIPVDLYAAARARRKAMKLVDKEGHPLGRRYFCPEEDKPLTNEDIVRGFETEDGRMVVITDQEFEAAAPEMSRDIELRRFVPVGQIPPGFFVRPYFLAPDARAGKAYSLLAQTMQRSGKAGIGGFVMRGREYLVAILSEGGVLRAQTLRYADELRTPEQIGLPEPAKPSTATARKIAAAVDELTESRLDLEELEDQEAEALHELAARKAERGEDVIAMAGLEDDEPEEGGAEVVDLMQVLRKSLGAEAPGKGAAREASPAPASRAGRESAAPRRAELPARKQARRAAPATPAPAQALDGQTKDELLKRAGRLGVAGRSRMSKDELVAALRAADKPPAKRRA